MLNSYIAVLLSLYYELEGLLLWISTMFLTI